MAGIVFQINLQVTGVYYVALVGFNLLILAILINWSTLRNHTTWLFNVALFLLIFSVGGALTQVQTPPLHPDYFGHHERIESVDGVLATDPEMGANTYKTTIRARAVYAEGKMYRTRGEFLLYVSNRSELFWEKGDRVLITVGPSEIEGPRNPGEFDYRQYLFNHGMTHRVFLRDPSQAVMIEKHFESSWLNYFDQTRHWMMGLLRKAVSDNDAFAVSSALILGQKEYLTPQIRSAYSGTGAMHVLAVSGLHVGIIYLILMGILKYLGNSKLALWSRLIIILAVLWSYAIITGLSPSVMRAATMFSAVAIAQNIQRRSNIFNTLAIAALVLMCIEPYIILEVGFQLSFLAVLGIVLFQPPIYKLLVFENKLADKAWELAAVSIAAQIATFPLGILYFNQFPNYFLLTNFVVIPGAFAILSVGLALMALSFVEPLFGVLGNLLNALVYFMNEAVRSIEALPHSVTLGLYINPFEAIVIYLILALTAALVYHRHVHNLLAALSLVMLLLFSYSWRVHERNSLKRIVVNDVSGNLSVNFIDGNTNILVADSAFLAESRSKQYHLSSFWYRWGHQSSIDLAIETDSLYEAPGFLKIGDFISFHGYRLKIVRDRQPEINQLSAAPTVDLLIVGGRSVIDRESAFQQVAVSSAYRYRQLCCDSLSHEVYDVRKNGAMEIDLNQYFVQLNPRNN